MVQIQSTKEHLRNLENPTNGSWWMVQILSTREDLRNLENPTNGSWWMVQIQPPKQSDPNAVKSDLSYMHLLWERRPDLNNPPTPVGGILKIQKGITLVGRI